MERVFKGLKVADFTWVGVGPLITKYLADFGATVVRIESSRYPDTIRLSAPFKDRIPGIDRSGYFALINGNKYGIAINLNHAKGIEVAKKLVAWADVVAESFAPGVMEKWGLGYENLKEINPDIIMIRTCNQGQTGPYAKHPGFGYQIAGLIGFPLLTGWPDRSPLPIPVAYSDYISYRFGAAALIAALSYRRRTGRGQYLDLSQVEASIQFLTPVMLNYVVNGEEPSLQGNSCPYAVPHAVYRCKGEDSWCVIAISNDQEWKAFVDAIGNPPWAANAKFATSMSRKENEAELDKLIEAYTINFTPEQVMTMLQSVGVPSGVVANGADLLSDPQIKARDYYWYLNHKEMGLTLTIGQPFKLSKTPPEPRMPSPCLGEHSEYVCKQILGMSDEEFAACLLSESSDNLSPGS